MAYFVLWLWLVPFALFVSLSANDSVLPTVTEHSGRYSWIEVAKNYFLVSDGDVVSNYFSKKRKYGLLTFFNYAKESLLPLRTKKVFWYYPPTDNKCSWNVGHQCYVIYYMNIVIILCNIALLLFYFHLSHFEQNQKHFKILILATLNT